MAEIKAFKGLRYTNNAGDMNKLVCPPYDIISREQRESFISENQYNIIRLELPKPVEDKIQDFAPYQEAGKTLKSWIENDILTCDNKKGIYVYEMVFNALDKQHSLKGFVSLVKLEEFSKGIVLPHEETLSKAKTDRFNLMKATSANFSQIYSLYSDNGEAYALIDSCSKNSPDVEVSDAEGVIHRLWAVFDTEVITKIEQLFTDKKLYIADGHHRYETALNYRNYLKENSMKIGSADYVPMFLADMENKGLVVFPTHRVVRDLQRFNINELIVRSKQYFDISDKLDCKQSQSLLKENYDKGKKAFSLYYDGGYYLMVLKDESVMKALLPNASKALRELDVSVLHTLILERIFGIDKQNMARQINLTYTKSANEAVLSVDNGKANCAFILNPTRVTEIKDIALAGEKMPQKSTYFYPKLITGLVMNKITE